MAASEPLQSRLDALLEKFAEQNDSGEEDNIDYLEFVDRRAHNPTQASQTAPELQFDNPQLQAEIDRAAQDEDVLNFEESADESGSISGLENEQQGSSPAASQPSSPASPSIPPSPTLETRDYVAEMYREAGLESPTRDRHLSKQPNQRRKTAKQIEREIEQAARENQELERTYGEEIGVHTVKTRTVDSFLASLSEDDDYEAPKNTGAAQPGAAQGVTPGATPGLMPAKPTPTTDTQLASEREAEDARFRQLVSSPPKMRGLRSFIAKPESQVDDSDSDLEVIPETKTNRMSRPVREMLKFSAGGGGTPSDRKLAAERAKLLRLQREQISARRHAKLTELKEHGLDLDDFEHKVAEKRQKSTMTADALLEQERQRAEALRDEEQNGDDSDSELEIEHVARHKKMLSDDESDDNSEDETKDAGPTERDVRPASRTDTGTDASLGPSPHAIGRTGTQIVEPLPEHALAEMLGISENDDENDEEDAGDANSDIVNARDESQAEVLTILSDHNEMEHVVQPDLSDLRNGGLPLSQQMAEVRQRFLQAQAEQRRQATAAERMDKQTGELETAGPRPVFKSKFLEDQAEESDDDDNAGMRGDKSADGEDDDDEDEDDPNEELHDLVDHSKVAVKESELKRQFVEEEKLRDQRTLTRLMNDVRGGFRRRRRGDGDQFLSDDELEFEEDDELESYRRAIEMRRKSSLVSGNSGVAKLAANARAAAFLTSISEDLISRPVKARKSSLDESLGFLRSVAERDSEYHAPRPAPAALDREDTVATDVNETSAVHDLPRAGLPVKRISSTRMPRRAERGSGTYASHISAADVGNAKTVQILQSLSRPHEVKNPKKAYVAPARAPNPKRPRHLVTVGDPTAKSESLLFKRNWG